MPTTVKIGLVAPFEGSYRSIGYDAVYAARLVVREINATGGIDGVRLELVAYDISRRDRTRGAGCPQSDGWTQMFLPWSGITGQRRVPPQGLSMPRWAYRRWSWAAGPVELTGSGRWGHQPRC